MMFGLGALRLNSPNVEGRVSARLQAERRGEILLGQWLSTDQAEQYKAHRYFDVVGCDTGRRYRIHQGAVMNIEELPRDGSRAQRLCFAPDGIVAVGDVMVAQKIALEKFELAALAIANKDGSRHAPGAPALEVVLLAGLGLSFASLVVLVWLILHDLKTLL